MGELLQRLHARAWCLTPPTLHVTLLYMKKRQRRASDGTTVQITIRVPKAWLPQADSLVEKLSRPGIPANQMDVFRAAIATGFDVLEKSA